MPRTLQFRLVHVWEASSARPLIPPYIAAPRTLPQREHFFRSLALSPYHNIVLATDTRLALIQCQRYLFTTDFSPSTWSECLLVLHTAALNPNELLFVTGVPLDYYCPTNRLKLTTHLHNSR